MRCLHLPLDAESLIYAEIPIRTPTLNVWQRMHWAKRSRLGRQVATEIWAALGGKLPERPMKKCRIRIERVSTQKPDIDGFFGGLKPLLDALQPVSKRHPYGLGIIVDDNAECIQSLDVQHVAGKAAKTRIWIEPVEDSQP